ncbi:hypothetical protein VTJ04DRAFT_490 [Mycothermus thermophilus]|uniref:uncharacterized protein n=1 Tax=Humicola insolens TaxID=85995 RepID=UPI0037436826
MEGWMDENFIKKCAPRQSPLNRSKSTRKAIRGRDSEFLGRDGRMDGALATASTSALALPEAKDDRTLKAAVTREFSKFGAIFVKEAP